VKVSVSNGKINCSTHLSKTHINCMHLCICERYFSRFVRQKERFFLIVKSKHFYSYKTSSSEVSDDV
jgi:hypothetical protein